MPVDERNRDFSPIERLFSCCRPPLNFPEARFSTASEALKSLDYFGIAAWSWAMPHIAEQMLSGPMRNLCCSSPEVGSGP